MQVAIVVFDGFDELDAIGPFEVLALAADYGADVDVRLVTLRPVEQVTASHGLRVEPGGLLEDGADLVIVPGGGWNDRRKRGAWAEAQRGDLPQALARLHRRGVAVASVCTGAMVASAAGLTKGRPVTTHHDSLDELRAEGANVVEARVVDDGDLLSAAGVTAGLDLALWLVEREFGRHVADKVESEIEYERHHDVHTQPGIGH